MQEHTSYAFHPMTLLIRHLSTDKNHIMSGLRKKTYFRLYWVNQHILHVLPFEHPIHFLLPLISKRQIPSSLLTFYISSHCTAIYIIHHTCPSDKHHQEVRKGRGGNLKLQRGSKRGVQLAGAEVSEDSTQGNTEQIH